MTTTSSSGASGGGGIDGSGCKPTHIRPHVKQKGNVRKNFTAHARNDNNIVARNSNDTHESMAMAMINPDHERPSLASTNDEEQPKPDGMIHTSKISNSAVVLDPSPELRVTSTATKTEIDNNHPVTVGGFQQRGGILKPPEQRKYNATATNTTNGDENDNVEYESSVVGTLNEIMPLKEACVKDLVIERKPEPMLLSTTVDLQSNKTLSGNGSTAVEGYIPKTGRTDGDSSSYPNEQMKLEAANMIIEKEEEYESILGLQATCQEESSSPDPSTLLTSATTNSTTITMRPTSTTPAAPAAAAAASYSVADLLARRHKFDEECFELEDVDVSFRCMSPEQYQRWQERQREQQQRQNRTSGGDEDGIDNNDDDNMSCTSTTESSSSNSVEEISKLCFRYINENDNGEHDGNDSRAQNNDVDPRLATKLSIGHGLFDHDGDGDEFQGDMLEESNDKRCISRNAEDCKTEDTGSGVVNVTPVATIVKELKQFDDEEEDGGDDCVGTFICNKDDFSQVEVEPTLPEPPPRAFIRIWNAFSGWVTPEATAAVQYFQTFPIIRNSDTTSTGMETDEAGNKDEEEAVVDYSNVNDATKAPDGKRMSENETDEMASPHSPAASQLPPPLLEHYQYDTSDVGCSRCGGLMAMMKMNLGRTLTELGLVEHRKVIQERIALLLMRFDFKDEMIKLDPITWRALTTILVIVVCGIKVVGVPVIGSPLTSLSQSTATGDTNLVASSVQLLPKSILAAGLVEDEFKYLAQSALLSFN